jgi:Ala-tRNA(Pro) deacylase
MAISKKVIKFLDKGKVKYEEVRHRTVYTAFDKAKTLGVPEKTIGKTLVIKMDRDFGIVLIPANKNLDKAKFKKVVNKQRKKLEQKAVKKIGFATESWIKKNLKGVKVGAIPPFGNLWKLPTFLDKSLLNNKKIIVNGGDYNWSFKISPTVFKKLVPDLILGNFSKKKK